jgi:hypothetical protein
MGEFKLQPSMSAGELAPSLHGNVTLAKFALGMETIRNFIVEPQGGASNRPGFQYVAEVKTSSLATRLKKFVFNSSQTYVHEYGNLYMRLFQDGAPVVYPVGHGSAGQVVEIVTPYATASLPTLQTAQDADVVYLAEQTYGPYKLTRTDHHLWTYTLLTFTPDIDGPAGISVTSSGSGSKTYKYKVTAISDTTGEESYSGYETTVTVSAATAANPVECTATDHGYQDGDEVLFADMDEMTELNGQVVVVGGISHTITAATQANPCEITLSAAHGMVSGEEIHIVDVVGMTQLNDTDFIATVVDATKVTLGVDSSAYGAYTSGGTATRNDRFTLPAVDGTAFVAETTGGTSARLSAVVTNAEDHEDGGENTLTWSAVAGARTYGVYRERNGVYGWIGDTEELTFTDDWITPDLAELPPRARNPFLTDFPAAVGFYDQRIAFGATPLFPSVFWLSQPTLFENFTVGEPLTDDSAITERMTSRVVATIRHFVELGGLMALTTGPEILISSEGPVVPGSLSRKIKGYRGASTVPPVVVGDALLYAQDRGNILWELVVEELGRVTGTERSILAGHLFEGKTIAAMDYQTIPTRVLWIVLSDGALVGMTYMKEHDIYAFHQHDSDGGLFEDVIVVPEGDEDRVYVIVQREVNGSSVRYVERMASRQWTDQVDGVFLDSSLTYSGADTATITGMGHLEAREVYAVAEGYVIGPLTVASGAVALGDTYSAPIHVGLLYTQDLETLNLDTSTVGRGKKARVPSVEILFKDTRLAGVQAGQDENSLLPFPDREVSDDYDLPALFTGSEKVRIQAKWENNPSVLIRNTLPLPCTVLSIAPEVDNG